MTAIFVSHRSTDDDEAKLLSDWLKDQGHQQLFLDFDPMDGIPAGVDWEQRLYQQLRRCQALLIVLTPDWLQSKWCSNELAIAREKGKAVFVVRAKSFSGGPVIPSIQEVDVTVDREAALTKLARGLKEHGLDPAESFDWKPDRPIYPGLAAFDIDDAAIFFGRSEESWAAVEALRRLRLQARGSPKLLLITGASGSGKSSLMRAGVLARLSKEPADWIITRPIRCGRAPIARLAETLTWIMPQDRRLGAARAFRNRLLASDAPSELLMITQELRFALNRLGATLVVALDQGEEFVAHDAPPEAAALIALFRSALAESGEEMVVVATIRSDRLATWQEHPAVKSTADVRDLAFQPFPLGPIPIARVSDIVRGPARYEGLAIADDLVDALRHDTATPDALPLLAYTLRYLRDTSGLDGQLTLDEYVAAGRLEGSVRNQADAAINSDSLSDEDRGALRDAFVPGLVRTTRSNGFVRTQALYSSMPERARPFIDRLIDPARLLVSSDNEEGNVTVEVAHEALLRAWPLLDGWINDDLERLERFAAIEGAAADYEKDKRADLLVHQGLRLEEAEALAATQRFSDHMSGEARNYLAACRRRQAAQERQRRRRRLVSSAVVVLMLFAGAGALVVEIGRRGEMMSRLLGEAEATYLAGDKAGALVPLREIAASWLPLKPDGAVQIATFWADGLQALPDLLEEAGPLSVIRVNDQVAVTLADGRPHLPVTKGTAIITFAPSLSAFVVADTLTVSVHEPTSFREILRLGERDKAEVETGVRVRPQAILSEERSGLVSVRTRTLEITNDEDEPEVWHSGLILLFRTSHESAADICEVSDGRAQTACELSQIVVSNGVGAIRMSIADEARIELLPPSRGAGVAVRHFTRSECDWLEDDEDCVEKTIEHTVSLKLETGRLELEDEAHEVAEEQMEFVLEQLATATLVPVASSDNAITTFPAERPESFFWRTEAKGPPSWDRSQVLDAFDFTNIEWVGFWEYKSLDQLNIVSDGPGGTFWADGPGGNSWMMVVSCRFDADKIVKSCNENGLTVIGSYQRVSEDKALLAQRHCAGFEPTIQIMEMDKLEFIDLNPPADFVVGSDFTRDSRHLAALTDANELLLYHIQNDPVVLTNTIVLPQPLTGRDDQVCDEGRPLLFLDDRVLVGVDVGGRLFAVDAFAGVALWYSGDNFHSSSYLEVEAAPQGRLFVLHDGRSVQVFDAATGLPLTAPFSIASLLPEGGIDRHRSEDIIIENVAISDDGEVRVTCTEFIEGCVDFEFVRTPPSTAPFIGCRSLDLLAGRDHSGRRIDPSDLLAEASRRSC